MRQIKDAIAVQNSLVNKVINKLEMDDTGELPGGIKLPISSVGELEQVKIKLRDSAVAKCLISTYLMF
jgi:hypothetical protein